MKKAILMCSILILVLVAFTLVGCNQNGTVDMSGKTPVVFELEGGYYQNCTGKIIHYYDVPENEEMLIYTPDSLSEKPVTKSNCIFDGWYQTKTVNGEKVTYSNEWDFKTNKISQSGVTLYAKWSPIIKLQYNVCYRDDDGKKVILGTYDVEGGDKFDDWRNYYKNRKGYTALGFLDESGNAWDPDYTHPGGEENLAIDVYVDYIKGVFELIHTGEQLVNLLTTNINKGINLYILADLDCGGGKLKFNNYTGTLIGNGHTISNFEMWYTAQKIDIQADPDLNAYASIFGNIKNATIKDVCFKDVTLNYSAGFKPNKICIAPLSYNAKSSNIVNVTVQNVTINILQLPSNFDETHLKIETDNLIGNDDGCTVENSKVENVVINKKY